MWPLWNIQRRSLYNFHCYRMKMPLRAFVAALMALALHVTLSAHDIPDEIVIQAHIRPEQNQLHTLLRVPLIAITDASLPKDGTGYLAMSYLDPALVEAANQ